METTSNKIWNELSEESKEALRNRYQGYVSVGMILHMGEMISIFGEENLDPNKEGDYQYLCLHYYDE